MAGSISAAVTMLTVLRAKRIMRISIDNALLMTNSKPNNSSEPQSPEASLQPKIKDGLVEALTSAYATLIKRQRNASTAFVRWSSPHRRAHEFTWIEESAEILMFAGRDIRIAPTSPCHESINKMMATIELNPYERELLYGYPYIVGQVSGIPIRAPLLTIPVTITADGGTLLLHPNEDMVRFNSLPFRSEFDTSAQELALARLIESTPNSPLTVPALRTFCESVTREMKVGLNGKLDGTIASPPLFPRANTPLGIVDCAACFVAPKTSYFLSSDLQNIGSNGAGGVGETALGWLIGTRPEEPTSETFADSKRVFFPFSSNPSQRRVALLANNAENRIIVVQGPPGTGKSLTIANVACHLIASGKRVLITSQKDKALDVVDSILRNLNLPQLPLTLLKQDRDSKRELKERLEEIKKTEAAAETRRQVEDQATVCKNLDDDVENAELSLANALVAEHLVAHADQELTSAKTFLKRLKAKWNCARSKRLARKRSLRLSDDIGAETTKKRLDQLNAALALIGIAAKHRTGEATKNARNQLREFSKLLGRDQANYKNFRVFDRMKSEPDRCQMLLGILPCWIMSPDDVARLFPCQAALFDTVIVDEASQCDLPSMTPVLYRAKQAIIVGDAKQMQAQRFAFTSSQVAAQAWREQGLDRLDPDGWLDPTKIDLLQLASIRMDEEAFLDEHYRSLPPIIEFSNSRWYSGRLRIMRDHNDRRFGDPGAPTVSLHRIPAGQVSPGTQENENEAIALVDALRAQLQHPGYSDASFGVICLFEQQMRLVNDLVAERIPEELRTFHDLVVVNPDGFQGDERDVIYYSLSFDADGMDQSALSARQADRAHIQGMLNVAFTRARDEVHIFHTAAIDKFGMASGSGAIRDWLEHCDHTTKNSTPTKNPVEQAQSEFEAQVIRQLSRCGVKTTSQYPSCGYFIDIVAELNGERIAIECDGEVWHLDEHGNLKIEDLQRQEILERAGWTVLRIPYRGWMASQGLQLDRVFRALIPLNEEPISEPEPEALRVGLSHTVTSYEAAIIKALKDGLKERQAILKSASEHMGRARLGPQLRRLLDEAVSKLEIRKLVLNEDNELFLAEDARTATFLTHDPPSQFRNYQQGRRRRRYRGYRRW
jgi:very-short-patch-repair endonuclease